MRLIDTAQVYGGGKSEELVGQVIAGQRDLSQLVFYNLGGRSVEYDLLPRCIYLLYWPSWPPGGLIDPSQLL